jgi:hypothetical protein
MIFSFDGPFPKINNIVKNGIVLKNKEGKIIIYDTGYACCFDNGKLDMWQTEIYIIQRYVDEGKYEIMPKGFKITIEQD